MESFTYTMVNYCIFKNRGRIQAQGDGCEKSESWAQDNIPTKRDGYDWITSLKGKITIHQAQQRKQCFDKATRLIQQAPKEGYEVCPPISYTPSPPYKDVRVDVEINQGKAFKDDN